MKIRDVVTGLVVLVVIIVGVLLIRNARNKKVVLTPSPTPSISQKVDKAFPNLNIPAGSQRVDLKDVTGGNSFGVATRTEIVANLPSLAAGKFYQGWLENAQGKTVLLGNLRVAKGGYLIEYDSAKFSGYNKIFVTLNSKHILEGSF